MVTLISNNETTMTTMMNHLLHALAKSGLLKGNLDGHLIRASMVIVFLLFGYQKWFEYEAQVLIPYVSNGPLISWMYPVFGIRGASWFLGVVEWLFCSLLFWGFWNRQAGIVGALGSCATYVVTLTIIPFMPNGWDEIAGGFPAMTGNVPFLVKRCRAPRCFILPVEAGYRKGDTFPQLCWHNEISNHVSRKDDGCAWPPQRRSGIPLTPFRDGDHILFLWLYKVASVRCAAYDPIYQQY